MLVNLLFLILGVGLVSGLIPKNRLTFLWSLFSVTAVSYLTYRLSFMVEQPDFHLVYPWLKIPNLAINMEIAIDAHNIHLVIALLGVNLLVLLQNTFSKEQAKNSLNGLVLLNLLSTLMLVFANNYIQMLVAVGVCDIFVYSAINNIEAKKKYIYTNFLANVGLISIFAIVLGNGAGIELKNLAEYYKFGHHKDFVAIMFLVCIFAKTGLFLFHGTYIDLCSLSFNRLNFILLTTTPLVGYLLLLKCESLLLISPYSYPILCCFSLASVAWGTYGSVVMDNLRQKSVYTSMMFWGLVYAFAALGNRLSPLDFATLLIAAFLFFQVFILINIAASNGNMVSEMGGFIKDIKITFGLSLVILSVYISAILSVLSYNRFLVWGYIVLLTLVSSHVGSQILLGKSRADEKVLAMLKNPSMFLWLPIALMTFALGYYLRPSPLYLLPILAVWFALFIFRPLKQLDKFYDKAEIQESDYLSNIYELLIVTPIKVIGRVLWLLIDFVFIERTVISSIQNALRFMVYVFKKIHSGRFFGEILFVLLGLGIVLTIWFYGGR